MQVFNCLVRLATRKRCLGLDRRTSRREHKIPQIANERSAYVKRDRSFRNGATRDYHTYRVVAVRVQVSKHERGRLAVGF